MWKHDGCKCDGAGSGSEERKEKEVDVQKRAWRAIRSLSVGFVGAGSESQCPWSLSEAR